MHTSIKCPKTVTGGSAQIFNKIAQTSQYKRFCDLIKKDVELLQAGCFVHNSSPNGYEFSAAFEEVKDFVWVYMHSVSTPASSCRYDNFHSCFKVRMMDWKYTQSPCTHEKAWHYLLSPYFVDNCALKDLYDNINFDNLPSDLKKGLENMSRYCAEPTIGSGYDENTWSLRLKKGLDYCLRPEYQVVYTAPRGLAFDSLQYNRCGLGPEFTRAYPFRGVPDICVQKSIYVNVDTSDDHNDSFEDSLFENVRQTSSRAIVPSKFGQLFASLHCFLVQRVLRRVLHGDSVQLHELEARGLYLSRQEGGYVTKATVRVFSDEHEGQAMQFEMQSIKTHILTEDRLCSLLPNWLGEPVPTLYH